MTTASATMAPERSHGQRMDALKRANEIRSARAQLKKDLKARRADAVEILVDPPEWAETMAVVDLIIAIPKYGRVKVNKLLSRNTISPRKTLGGLSERQRRALVAALGGAW